MKIAAIQTASIKGFQVLPSSQAYSLFINYYHFYSMCYFVLPTIFTVFATVFGFCIEFIEFWIFFNGPTNQSVTYWNGQAVRSCIDLRCTAHCTHRKWMWILKTMMKGIKWIRFKRKHKKNNKNQTKKDDENDLAQIMDEKLGKKVFAHLQNKRQLITFIRTLFFVFISFNF